MKKSLWENILLSSAASAVFIIMVGHAFSTLEISHEGFIFNDFSIMRYFMESGRRLYAETGGLSGYDPHFMAGYSLGFIWNSNIALQRIAVTFAGVSIGDIISAIFFWGIFLFPVAWWSTLRVFGLSRQEAAGGFILGCLYFLAGLPAMFFYTGMMTAGAMVYFSLLSLAFVYRYIEDGGAWIAGAIIFTAATLYVHKTSGIILAPAWTGAMALCVHRKCYGRIAGLTVVALLAVVLNWEWIGFILQNRDMILAVPDAPFWRNKDLLLPVREYFTGTAFMNTLEIGGLRGAVHSVTITGCSALGIAGAVDWWRRGEKGRVIVLVLPAALLWLFSYYGGLVSFFGELNPTRYLSVVHIMFAAAGGTALSSMLSGNLPRNNSQKNSEIHPVRNPVAVVIALLIILSATGCTVFLSQWFRPFNAMLSAAETVESVAITEKISQLPAGGRIMIEDSGAMDEESSGQVYGKSHIVSSYGIKTSREFIGGPYPYVFLKNRYASFYDAKVFGENLSHIRPEELHDKLKLYNVKWIICWSDAAKQYFDRYSGYFSQADELGPFNIYEVTGYEPDSLLKGDGDVSADYGKIELKNAIAENGELILKYHWPVIFRTEPKITMKRFHIEDDPVGFIKVIDPPPEFTIMSP